MAHRHSKYSRLALAIFALLLHSSQAQKQIAPEYQILNLGEMSRNYKISEDETKYFKLLMDPKRMVEGAEQDLVVKVFAEDENQGDPDVYISKTNLKPNRESNSQWACSSFGDDTCSIPFKDIRVNDTFYMGVRCGSTYDGFCTFSIQPTLKGEILLEDGVMQEYDFGFKETKLFKFKIPASQRGKDDSNKVKSVVVTAAPLLPIDEQISLVASTKGALNPKQANVKKGVPGWRKGQTLRISEEDVGDWCTDCFLTIILDVSQAGKYEIMAKTNLGIVQLEEGVKIDDVAFYGHKQCYKYNIKQADTDVNIKVAQFSGVVSYIFHPRIIPERFEDAAFQSAQFGNSALSISPVDRKDTPLGLYYLCVQSHMTSTFSAVVFESLTNETFHQLEDGWDQTAEVQGTQVTYFVYKVPPLDFSGEDIAVEFLLTSLSGETPRLYAAFCKDSQSTDGISMNGGKRCGGAGLKKEDLLKKPFVSGKAVGKGQSLIIDHDEEQCQKKYNGECFYTVAVVGQGRTEGDISKFSLTAIHSQQNFYLLQENVVIQDYVNLGTYRYYSFTLPEAPKGSPEVVNVTFSLNSLHGDADLFASRIHKYPNRMDFEKNSVRTADSNDVVYFDKNTNGATLMTTYYIAVYSYQYSTYTLVVNVDRNIKKDGKKDQEVSKMVTELIEGYPVRGYIPNMNEEVMYKIHVKQVEGFEKPIKIQLSPLQGKLRLRVSAVGPLDKDPKDYKWGSTDNLIVIDPKTDPNFKREATYFIQVSPKVTFWESFNPNLHFAYYLSYLTEDSTLYLKSQMPLEQKQKAGDIAYQYFRHIVSTFNKDISISMTVFSGNPTLYASFDPSQKWPNKTTPATFSSKNQGQMAGGAKGKALFFPQQLLHVQNPACKSTFVESQEPCMMYLSVLCEGQSDEECRYTLKVTYENSGPQQLIIGQPQHTVVKDGTFNYYYLTVKESSINPGQQIVGVLSSMKGNTDLYVKFIDTPQRSTPQQWDLPNEKEYIYKSVESSFKQDVIKIDANKDSNLQECFKRFDKKYGTEAECTIVYGIYSPLTQEGRDAKVTQQGKDLADVDKFSSRYNFVVYLDVMQLMNQVPVSDQVDINQFQYYLYESTCDDCTILVSLSTVGSGDPDLYINFGDEKLPTRDQADMMSSTLKSEVITINLQHQYFKKQGIKSMKGPYLIGVYGQKKSNYTLVISQEKQPMALLIDNTAMRASQEPFDILYYGWYNVEGSNVKERDFRITLNVKNGQADVYITTFVDIDNNEVSQSVPSQQNIVQRLPKNKKDALWILEGITPKTDLINRQLVVVNQERNYCNKCFYLIGVVTHEDKTDYSLQLDVMNQADFENSMILKLGETYHANFNAEKGDTKRIYRFIIDDLSPIQILQNVENGHIETSLSLTESGENPIMVIINTKIATFSPEDKNFQVDRMYYLIVNEFQGSSRTTHSLMIMQERTIIKLSDGVPQSLKFNGKQDLNKLMIFSIPDGQYTFSIQVKSKTDKFFPKLYIKYYEDLDANLRGLEFPPGGEPGYFIAKNWEYKLGIMNYQEKFEGIKGGKSGLAMNLIDSQSNRDDLIPAEAVITVSASPVLRMISGQTYLGTLDHSTSFKIYQVEETILSKTGYLMIDFTPCVGDTEFKFIENPNQPNKHIEINKTAGYQQLTQYKHGKIYHFIPLPRKSLFILVRQINLDHKQDLEAEFMIKVRQNDRVFVKNNEYYLSNDGKLDYNILEGKSGIELSWGQLYYSNQFGSMIEGNKATYSVFATKDSRARLDTQCVMRKDIASKYVLASFNEQKETSFRLETPVDGQRYYVNVIAKIQPDDESEPEIIPYVPVEIYIPQSQAFISKLGLLTFVVLATFFIGSALYFYVQQKKSQARLTFETRGPRPGQGGYGQNSGPSYNRAIEMSNIQRSSRQNGKEEISSVGGYQPVTVASSNGVDDSIA